MLNFKSTYLDDYWAICPQIGHATQWWPGLSIYRVISRDNPRGFSWFFQSRRMEVSNTPLDAESHPLLRFYNYDMDLVIDHAIIPKIHLDLLYFFKYNHHGSQTYRWMRKCLRFSNLTVLRWISRPIGDLPGPSCVSGGLGIIRVPPWDTWHCKTHDNNLS